MLTIVSFIIVLLVLVLTHEVGHFFTARVFGVGVEEFGLGFPPRIVSIKRGGTRYSLNALPLGGFVKLAGEEDPSVLGSLAGKSLGIRVLVLSAGSIMNFLLPLLLFSVSFMVPHDIVVGQVMVEKVAPGSPAMLAGIQPGDALLSLDGKTIRNAADLYRYVQLNLGKKVTILVKHSDSSTETVRLIPRWQPPEGQGAMGVAIRTLNPTIVRERYPFWQAIPAGIIECVQTFILFKNEIISMVIGSAPVAVTGPVGIAQITGEVAKAGIGPLLEFAAFLSMNLAVINLFPLPALDGGRIAFVLLEWVRRGKRISPKTESRVHLIGFAMLMMAILLVTYQDILRIISGESLIP